MIVPLLLSLPLPGWIGAAHFDQPTCGQMQVVENGQTQSLTFSATPEGVRLEGEASYLVRWNPPAVYYQAGGTWYVQPASPHAWTRWDPNPDMVIGIRGPIRMTTEEVLPSELINGFWQDVRRYKNDDRSTTTIWTDRESRLPAQIRVEGYAPPVEVRFVGLTACNPDWRFPEAKSQREQRDLPSVLDQPNRY